MNQVPSFVLKTIATSTEILKDKSARNLDMNTEIKKWNCGFGDDVGQLLEKTVKNAMPDYELLRNRRLKIHEDS
ncbi:hypothetical protein PENSTE_c023G09897 [Penicillium steckii]|uniref:Uncharacterized protein n=1 Tax=Penicillium steckii TaxID=303698 RepID=A0A1V6SRI9_9EURO|nr:hypothetical protein PENSTE_c023G09897 [Penicillium steckii]